MLVPWTTPGSQTPRPLFEINLCERAQLLSQPSVRVDFVCLCVITRSDAGYTKCLAAAEATIPRSREVADILLGLDILPTALVLRWRIPLLFGVAKLTSPGLCNLKGL